MVFISVPIGRSIRFTQQCYGDTKRCIQNLYVFSTSFRSASQKYRSMAGKFKIKHFASLYDVFIASITVFADIALSTDQAFSESPTLNASNAACSASRGKAMA